MEYRRRTVAVLTAPLGRKGYDRESSARAKEVPPPSPHRTPAKRVLSKYSQEQAAAYSQLGISGTTYEVGFNEMARLLGPLEGKAALDFGCGTGRSATLLKVLGAERVVGVDRNVHMLSLALRDRIGNVEFHLIDRVIPLPDSSIDVAVSAHVFVEMKSIDEMRLAAGEICRVLKRGGQFILISANPSSIGCEYESWTYKKRQERLESGDVIICAIKGPQSFEVEDVYWTEQDYRYVLESAGFEIGQVTYPRAVGEGWRDETRVAPNIVVDSRKAGRGDLVGGVGPSRIEIWR